MKQNREANVRGTRFDPKAFLLRADEGKTITRLKAGEVVYKQGEPATMLHYLQAGRIKVTVISEHGKEAMVGILEPGEFFGETSLTNNLARLTTTTTLAPSVITTITRDAMMEWLVREPAFLQLFLMHLLHRNSRIEADLMDQLFNSSEKRLARLLLLLAHYGTERGPHVIGAEISQEMLAEMIGTTRPRVNHFMNKFRKLGFIRYNGEIEVNASLLTTVLHESRIGERR